MGSRDEATKFFERKGSHSHTLDIMLDLEFIVGGFLVICARRFVGVQK
jgi:hypothetical protein